MAAGKIERNSFASDECGHRCFADETQTRAGSLCLRRHHLGGAQILACRLTQHASSERHYATLTAFVIERQAAITDLAVDMFSRLIGSNRRKAEISRKERRLKEADVLDGVAAIISSSAARRFCLPVKATPVSHPRSQPPLAGTG
ncbi:hypothetical protein [Mesorhizobium sp. M2A.F.Ca.ET.039.01.1.1]|uniref:hypothetical protein n=1 Tax=Mesorhizobium sp. M2A.F.Ca.ET.039.01.1.1 TaxID=2496746 RepID=UPI001672C878|nr:hypothetical protein [Mesorhizobium sp. M2A.F.Ca.ET.039.01.1.1]